MNSNLKKLIYDIGMFDGADTRYYLNKGYKVLAVEANPIVVKRAFSSVISTIVFFSLADFIWLASVLFHIRS